VSGKRSPHRLWVVSTATNCCLGEKMIHAPEILRGVVLSLFFVCICVGFGWVVVRIYFGDIHAPTYIITWWFWLIAWLTHALTHWKQLMNYNFLHFTCSVRFLSCLFFVCPQKIFYCSVIIRLHCYCYWYCYSCWLSPQFVNMLRQYEQLMIDDLRLT